VEFIVLDFNRSHLSSELVNIAINDAIERAAAARAELPRPYLGASIVGDECMRKVQYAWWCKPVLSSRVRDIFDRGHYFEDVARQHLIAAGFKFAPPAALEFSVMDGNFKGHADGIIFDGPNPLNGAYFNFPFLWECKCLNAKNYRAIERDGLEKAFPKYAAQVALYQNFLEVMNPALFSVVNADSCERLHFWVPFNAEHVQYWIDRIETIIEATRAGELLPRAFSDPQDWHCVVCEHKTRCWGQS
jgi:hypothetical protein